MSATTSLRTILATQFTDWPVYELRVPDNADLPYVWLGRRGTEDTGNLVADVQPFVTYVDVEVYAADPDTALDRADAIRDYLKPLKTTFAGGTIQGVLVTDQSDDYELRNAAADDTVSVGLLNITLINYEE